MRFRTARQVIHDAFTPDLTTIDICAAILEFGVQFTAKGSANRTMDHVEKGYIQQALAIQKEADPICWAWNMYAYAPTSTPTSRERSMLLQWAADTYLEEGREDLMADQSGPIMRLARVAMHDIAQQDRTGRRLRRRMAKLSDMVGVEPDEYESRWHHHYVRFRGYYLELPEKSLPPIARITHLIAQKRLAGEGQAIAATEDLRRALSL